MDNRIPSIRPGRPVALGIPEALRPGVEIVRRLRAAGWETYLVGGVVRDLLLGRQPADLDIATAAPPEAVAAAFERTVPVGAEFGVISVVIEGHPFQVATFRQEGPYLDGRHPSSVAAADLAADARRRDFTINALYYDPITGTLLDPVGGRADLEGRCVRTVGDPAERLAEDYLRLLRAVRLAAELGFALESATLAAIARLAPHLGSVSAERVRDELVRLLVAPGRGEAVRLLASTGLLRAILPEVADRVSGSDDARHAWDRTARALDSLRRPTPVLATATLLAPFVEARAAEAVCRRLRFSAGEVRAIGTLVRDRRRVARLPHLPVGQARRLVRRPDLADLLEVDRVVGGAVEGDVGRYRRAARVVAALAGVAASPRLLTGDDLVAMGYPPGPRFTEMLEAVEDARAAGDIRTAEEARLWIETRYGAGATSSAVEPPDQKDPGRGSARG